MYGASLIAHLVNHLPAMQETRVQFLGQEDPLEKEMATHSGILAWKIPWTEEPGRLQSTVRKELEMTEQLHFRINKCIVRTGTQKGLRNEIVSCPQRVYTGVWEENMRTLVIYFKI